MPPKAAPLRRIRSADALATPGGRPLPFSCSFCSGAHPRARCTQYSTLEQRIERCKQLKLCFNCLAADHNTVRCPKPKIQCRNCNAQHNLALCVKYMKDFASSGPSAVKPHKASLPPPVRKTTVGMVSTSAPDESIKNLLMSTRAAVYNPNNVNHKETICVFFDPGSTRSFITESLSEKLGLVPERTEL